MIFFIHGSIIISHGPRLWSRVFIYLQSIVFFFNCWTISREFGSDNKAHIILLSFTPKPIFVELVPLVTLNDSNFLSFGLTGVRCTSDVTLSLGVGVRCNPLDHSDGSRLALIGRFQRLFNSPPPRSKQYTHTLSPLSYFSSVANEIISRR